MSDVNVTIDARAALRAVINSRYGVDIAGALWATVTPADDPPAGLGSQDITDWQITLDRASARMAKQGYAMAEIAQADTETARGSVLDDSVSLLVSKASGQARSLTSLKIDSQHMIIGAGAGLVAGAVVMVGAALYSSQKERH